MNIEQQFNEMVQRLSKAGKDICSQLTARTAHRVHMAIGISGESGELLDAIKKEVIYNKEPDLVNIIEELGDLEFYMEGLRHSYGITREDTLIACQDKLDKGRYANGSYSDEQAQTRADKV